MRKVFITGMCALLLTARAEAVHAQTPKFAYINSQQLVQAAPGSVEAQATLEKELAGFRAQIQKMSDSMTTLQTTYQKDEPTLSATAKEARLKALRDRQTEFQEKAQKLNDQSDARQQELMTPVLDMVRKVLDEVRAEGGYAMIFDVAGNGGAFIASVDKNLDITDKVLSRLKLAAPLKAVSPSKTTGPTTKPAGVTTAPKKPPTQ
jgi:outer membrane protein